MPFLRKKDACENRQLFIYINVLLLQNPPKKFLNMDSLTDPLYCVPLGTFKNNKNVLGSQLCLRAR